MTLALTLLHQNIPSKIESNICFASAISEALFTGQLSLKKSKASITNHQPVTEKLKYMKNLFSDPYYCWPNVGEIRDLTLTTRDRTGHLFGKKKRIFATNPIGK